jgi:recombination protein RecA
MAPPKKAPVASKKGAPAPTARTRTSPKADALKRASARDTIIAAVNKKFGKDAAYDLKKDREASAALKEFLCTGIDPLDYYVLGSPERGGFAVGRISEVFGAEGSGKTSFGYAVAADTQRKGGVACIIDAEFSFDPGRAEVFGVDTDELILLQPKSLEELFNQMRVVLTTHDPKFGPLLLVWDSVATTKPEAGIGLDAGKGRRPGDVAALMSQELPKILNMLPKARAHLMMINQVRVKFGVLFGDNSTTPGGNAPKFYASQRISILGGKAIKNSLGEHIGKIITVLAVKNRLVSPFRKAKVRLDYATGFNTIWSTCEHAKRMKVLKVRGCDLDIYELALDELGWPAKQDQERLNVQATALGVATQEEGDDDEEDETEEEEDDED